MFSGVGLTPKRLIDYKLQAMTTQSNASCECSECFGYNTPNVNTVYTKMEKAKNHNFFGFTAQLGVGFITLLYCTVLQCDLLPLRPHYGEASGRDLNPGRAI